tara:strand:+ start:2693 stop:5347 length:2655 start_codon:yes stop_codon:yes gene_type:complete
MTKTTEKLYKKGSEWRKWDLHIHTPNSHLNNNYNCDYKTVADKIINEKIDVIGVTNYFIVEELEITELQKHLPDEILIIPNFEFRINDKNKSGEYINVHILFNPFNVKLTEVYSSLSRITLNNLAEDTPQYCTIENIKKFGAETITVSFDELIKQLNTDFKVLEDYLIVGVSNGYGGFHPDNKPRNINLALKMDKYSHLIFGREQDSKFFLNLEGQRNKHFDSPKAVVECSDAHSINDIGSKFTWIKADPTFEGLKQVLFEPNERVIIKVNNPSLDFDKPYFSSIKFNDNVQVFQDDKDLIFDKKTKNIPLNANLVTIIGGRGEGKSMLTEYISSSFYGKENTKEGEFHKSGNIEIEYSKTILKNDEKINFQLNDEKHSVDFIYISQGDLKNKVEGRDKKSKLASSISKLAKLDKPPFNSELNKTAINKLSKIHILKEELDKKENSLEFLDIEEKRINNFITNITTKDNKEKLEKYSSNISLLNSQIIKKEQLNSLKEELSKYNNLINLKISTINEDTNKIPKISEIETSYPVQVKAIDDWNLELDKNIAKIKEENLKIKEKFGEVFKGDLTTLLKDVDNFQKSLLNIRQKINDVKSKTTELQNLKENIFLDKQDETSIVSQIKKEYENQKLKLLKDWETFNEIDENQDLNPAQKDIMKNLLKDLTVDVIIDFDIEKFYNEIYNCINGAIWRVKNNLKAQKNYFKIKDLNSFFKFLIDDYLNTCENNGIYIDTLTKILFDEEIRKNYISVYPILKYEGKDLNKISVGQKGTVYLKIMLATEAFSKPIIFDQPEDDLDNEFIMNNLIDLFKELKKYRQVIIVTHNANLVVNADAEQVIVANNVKGKLQYTSGSLENETINSQICRILEGGEIAFEKRRKKYKMIK